MQPYGNGDGCDVTLTSCSPTNLMISRFNLGGMRKLGRKKVKHAKELEKVGKNLRKQLLIPEWSIDRT